MRVVTRRAISALMNGKDITVDNTMVRGDTLYLHGNPIIQVREDGVYIQTCGWNTITTRERLNGLPKVRVYSHKRQLHLNGAPWDGNWIKVDTDLE
jgi:hypothetical protein